MPVYSSITDAPANDNVNLNPPGSSYATDYSHSTESQIGRIYRKIIYDSSPQQYNDLKILMNAKPEKNWWR